MGLINIKQRISFNMLNIKGTFSRLFVTSAQILEPIYFIVTSIDVALSDF